MKRPLTAKDYERMTYASVDARYGETGSYDLYKALCMHGWDSVLHNGYIKGQKELTWRKHALFQVYEVESDVLYTRRPLMQMIREEPKTYRISVNQKGGVETVCFDLENIDSELEGYYDAISDLPVWVQERVAVLAVCNPEPPTHVVEGVGRRISENVYWIYK